MNPLMTEYYLDDTDRKILQVMSEMGRITWTELAATVKLSGPAVADRVRRLEDRGVIQGYTTILDARVLGLGITAFIGVTLERAKHRKTFMDLVSELPEVQECYHISGEDDFLLKIRCRDTLGLEKLILDRIKNLTGVIRARATVVLSSVKETTYLPLTNPLQNH